jgi:cell division septal protein FtsQ
MAVSGVQVDNGVWGLMKVGGLSERQLARRIERRVANSQRRKRVLIFVVCAVILIFGLALLAVLVKTWFISF